MRHLIIILVTAFLAIACGNSQPAPVREAIESLERVQAATQVGTTYAAYVELVANAKVKVNAAVSSTNDETTRSNLISVLDNYQDAANLWLAGMRGERLNIRTEPGYSLLPQYSFTVDGAGDMTNTQEQALSYIWSRADETLSKLSKIK